MKANIVLLILCLYILSSTNVLQSSNSETMGGTLFPSASFLGTHYKERVGYVLCCAGDMNGDNYDDFIIGTFHNHSYGWDAGAVYLILGRPVVNWGMDYSLNNVDARFLNGRRLDAVGFAIAGNGDVNGDGLSDILIGAPAGNNEVASRPGQVFVVLGDSTASWGFNFILNERAAASYSGEFAQDLAGRAIAIIDDQNEDGCDEILCAAPYNDYGGIDAGKVYLVMGRNNNWSKSGLLAEEAIASFYYANNYGTCGYSVANIGDVNNDGIGDFAIGATGVSRVFVILGRRQVNWGANYDLGHADLVISGENPYRSTALGWLVAGVGDVNGDSIDDFIMSATEDNTGGFQAGKVYLILGRSGGWNSNEFNLSDADASYIGEKSRDQAGWGIGGAGDVNGDGYNDFLIGAWKNNYGYPEAGKAYFIYGKRYGWQRDIELQTISTFFSGVADTNFAGYAVSSTGDIDNDGWGDYIISAPYNSEVNQWSGKIYLFASQRLRHHVSGYVNYNNFTYPVENTNITFKEHSSKKDTMTDDQGFYQAMLLGKSDYYVIPYKNIYEDVVEDCITAYDAALVARHSVKLDTIIYPLVRCADANVDNKVNMYDASLLLLASVRGYAIENSSIGEWIFEPDSILLEELASDHDDINFNALIRGDVDANWSPQTAGFSRMMSKSIVKKAIRHNNRLIIPIEVESNKNIISIDVHLRYDPHELNFINVEKGQIGKYFQLAYHSHDNGILKIGAFAINPVNQGGNFINIEFNGNDIDKNDVNVQIERMRINNIEIADIAGHQGNNVNQSLQLFQNYPNPFNGNTEICYQIVEAGKIELSIFNTVGQEIFSFVDEKSSPGYYKIGWNGIDNEGNNVPTGVYICQVVSGTIKKQIKLVYIK